MADSGDSPPASSRPPRPAADLGVAAAAALVTYAIFIPQQRLWKLTWRVPMSLTGDGNFHAMLTKSVLKHGWFLTNANLGAPFGQHMADFPVPDILHVLLLKFIGLFTNSYGVAVNVFYVATYGLVAATAAWVMRRLGVSRLAAVALAALYALLPYHFARGENHLFLSAYYTVPPAAYLLMLVMRGEPLLAPADGRPAWRRLVSGRVLAVLVASLLIGASSGYYAGFTLTLLAAAAPLALFRFRRWTVLLLPAFVFVAILGSLVVCVMPTILYTRAHGPDPAAASRSASDTELYSLKLAQMILPSDQHRIAPLARFRQKYERTFPVGSEGPAVAVGVVASLGFLWLLTVPLLALLRPADGPDSRHRELSALALFGFLVATTGGLATLTSFFLTSSIRSWNRMIVFLAFFGLVAVGHLLDRLPAVPWMKVAAVGAVLGVGVFDQTSLGYVIAYRLTAEQFDTDAAFVHQIEGRVPQHAMIFQLPAVQFPGAGTVVNLFDYDHLRGYLHSDELRWSYGAVKGRPDSDWQYALNDLKGPVLVPALAAAGYDGIWIDRRGFEDQAAALIGDVGRVLNQPALDSGDGREAFFSLAAYRSAMTARKPAPVVAELGEAVLHPPRAEYGPGFGEEFYTPVEKAHRATGRAVISLVNPGTHTRRVTLQFGVSTDGGPTVLHVTLPNGSTQDIDLSAARAPVKIPLALAPGTARAVLTSSSPAPFTVMSLVALNDDVDSLAPSVAA